MTITKSKPKKKEVKRTYVIFLVHEGEPIRDSFTAIDRAQARQLCWAQYPGCEISRIL